MTDAYDIYKEVDGLVNKEENGYLPASLFNTYARTAVRDVFNDYGSRLQNVQTASVEKLKLQDRLAPFEMNAILPAQDGQFLCPDDYAYFHAAKIKADGAAAVELYALYALLCEAGQDPTINVAEINRQIEDITASETMVEVTLKDHDQVAKRLKSYVPGKKPSMQKPIMERLTVLGKKGFQVYPAVEMTVFLSYYRRPLFPLLVLDEDPITKEPVYNLAASKAFEFEEEAMTDVVKIIVDSFSIYIREGGLFQMANAKPKG